MSNILSPAEVEFWLDTSKYANYFEDQMDPAKQGLVFNIDMVRLSSIRKAISNFVRILTRKNIPVYFNDMDANVNVGGKTIYISAKITSKQDFDVAVGQALHEAAHTLLTDFDAVKIAWTNIPHKIFKLSDEKNIRRASIEKFIQNTWNVIEDRYIDNYVFTEAPGYRGYYVALYEKFWNCPEIDEYLISDLFRYPSLDSYSFRITNFTNENTDLTALPRLDEIAELISISTIDRLKTTKDRINVTFEVVEIVLNSLDIQSIISDKGNSKKQTGLAKPEDFFDFGDSENIPKSQSQETYNPPDNKNSQRKDVDVGKKMVEEIGDVLTGKDPEPEKLMENDACVNKIAENAPDDLQKKQIKSIIENQRQFLWGEIPKEKVTSAQKELLDLIEKHGIVLVKIDVPNVLSGDDKNLQTTCIVVREMTKELVVAGQRMFPLCGIMKMGNDIPEPPKMVDDAVKKGILLGTKLGRKLQIRNEINPTKIIRKKSGKINKRLLHSASYDADDLFYLMKINEHNKASLHISVDASGSMSRGNKWTQTMTAVVAICKAASMVDNVHVTVSFRTTQVSNNNYLPYVILAYDSKKDKFSKVRTLFPYLVPNGYTPEGLAFNAIMHLFENITPDEQDRYFLNLSDGEPCYVINIPSTGLRINYEHEVGVNHTKSQVDRIKQHGVEVLSYFIDDSNTVQSDEQLAEMSYEERMEYNKLQGKLEDTPLRKNFRKMYGKNAQFINVESVVDLAKTINKLFLSKSVEKRA